MQTPVYRYQPEVEPRRREEPRPESSEPQWRGHVQRVQRFLLALAKLTVVIVGSAIVVAMGLLALRGLWFVFVEAWRAIPSP